MTNEDVLRKLIVAAEDIKADRLHAAEEVIVEVLAVNPNHADALHMQGQIFLHLSETGSAISILEDAVRARPTDPEIRCSLATALGMQERYADVVSVCRTGLKNIPGSAPLYIMLGRALGLLGANEEAVKALETANGLSGPDPFTLSMMGTLYFRLDDLANSAWAYEAALKLAPHDIETRFNLVSLHIRNLDYETAVEGLEGILKLDGDHLPSLRALGNLLGRTDRYLEAIKPLQRLLELVPNDNLGVNELIYAQSIAGSPNEAVELGKAFLHDNPDATFIYRQLAFAEFCNGRPDLAAECCDRALQFDRPPTTALSIKSAALNELGERKAAADILRLDTLVQAEIPSPPLGNGFTYGSVTQFNEDLQERILNHPSLKYTTSNRSMKKGRGTAELFNGSESGAIAVFKNMVFESVDAYMKGLPGDLTHPFIRHMPQDIEINAWGNVYDDDGMQEAHFHPPAWLSGVYYPISPDRVKESAPDDIAGALELGRAYFRLQSSDDPPVRIIKPEDGLMVLFPSYISHQTVPLGPSESPRVSIAFDIIPIH
jgi:tetratricopeptide (TPR) repeat protein